MSVNPTTGLPFEPLHPEYLVGIDPGSKRGSYVLVNRQGDIIHLTSAMLAEHMQWAYALPSPQGADE